MWTSSLARAAEHQNTWDVCVDESLGETNITTIVSNTKENSRDILSTESEETLRSPEKYLWFLVINFGKDTITKSIEQSIFNCYQNDPDNFENIMVQTYKPYIEKKIWEEIADELFLNAVEKSIAFWYNVKNLVQIEGVKGMNEPEAKSEDTAQKYIDYLISIYGEWKVTDYTIDSIKRSYEKNPDNFENKFTAVYKQSIEKQTGKTFTQEKLLEEIEAKSQRIKTSKQKSNQTREKKEEIQDEVPEITPDQISKCEKIKETIQPIFEEIMSMIHFFKSKADIPWSNWKKFRLWPINSTQLKFTDTIKWISKELRRDVNNLSDLQKYEEPIEKLYKAVLSASVHNYYLYVEYLLQRPTVKNILSNDEEPTIKFKWKNIELSAEGFRNILQQKDMFEKLWDIKILHNILINYLKKRNKKK